MARLLPYNKFRTACYEKGRVLTFQQIERLYLLTDRWDDLRSERLAFDKYRCRMCGRRATCVHHCVYPAILGDETLDDLTSLCHNCHENYHRPPGLNEVRQQVYSLSFGKGTDCPCCDRHVKRYKRKLNQPMIICLREFQKHSEEGEFAHIHDITAKSQIFTERLHGGNFALMRFWGLIEEMPKDPRDKKKRTSGYWRVTELGKKFLNGEVTVPRYTTTYNGKKESQEGSISFNESLHEDFDYEELMNTPAEETEEA